MEEIKMLDAVKCYDYRIDLIATGRNIRNLREARGITRNYLADVFDGDASIQAISKWETGKTLPRIDNLFVLSKVFDVSIDEIIVGCGSNPPHKAA